MIVLLRPDRRWLARQALETRVADALRALADYRDVSAVDIEPSRILVITSPAGFERFVFDLGVPATGDEPPPGLSLPPRDVLMPIAQRHGIEIVGPTIRSEAG